MDLSRLTWLERNIHLLRIRTLVLSVLLFASLGANAAWVQAAFDPPHRVYRATLDDAGAGGSFNDGNFQILPQYTRASPRVLLSLKLNNLGDHRHFCLVTASAQVHHPANTPSGMIVIGLSRGPGIKLETERFAHLVATPDEDQDYEEVTTTFAFRVRDTTIGSPIVHFVAAYQSGGVLTVAKPSMTVVCLNERI